MKPDTYDEVVAQRDAARAEAERLREVLKFIGCPRTLDRERWIAAEAALNGAPEARKGVARE